MLILHLKLNREILVGQNGLIRMPISQPEKELPVLWTRMPFELRQKRAQKRSYQSMKQSLKVKQKRLLDDPSKILAKLEEREKLGKDDEAEGKCACVAQTNLQKV